MIASDNNLRILSQVPGRMRVHLLGWTQGDVKRIENRLRRVEGVKSVQANLLTGNVLIHFDHRSTDEKKILAELAQERTLFAARQDGPLFSPPALRPSLLQVGVRGLLGHAIVDSLWFGAGFLGKAVGLPLAGLGPLHVLMDIGVWAFAFQSGSRTPVTSLAGRMPSEPAVEGAGDFSSEGRFMDGAKRSTSPQR